MAESAGNLNIVFGWCWLNLGIIMGLTIGMWAEGETWLGGYTSVPRRLLRLSHIAFIALSMINILYGLTIERSGISGQLVTAGSWAMVAGAVGIPVVSMLAAFHRPIKYVFPLPALAVLFATLAMALALCGLW